MRIYERPGDSWRCYRYERVLHSSAERTIKADYAKAVEKYRQAIDLDPAAAGAAHLRPHPGLQSAELLSDVPEREAAAPSGCDSHADRMGLAVNMRPEASWATSYGRGGRTTDLQCGV
jgi:hypothetical protein